MGFKHGTSVSEVPSKIKGMVTVTNPIVCVGSAPINMGDITNINKPQLIYTPEEAAEYFGGTNKIPGFTISEFLNAAFNVFQITPILCINVCDPAKHGEEVVYTEREIDAEKQIIFEVGIIPETLIITDSAVEPETKHDLEFDGYFELDGTYVVEITTEDIPAGTIIEGSYTKLDPSLVTDEDIIGGIDLETLEKVGLEVVNNIFSTYSMIPSVVITPSFYSNEIRAALDAKTSKINNKWGAVSFIDMPEDLKYGETIAFKKDNNWIDSD